MRRLWMFAVLCLLSLSLFPDSSFAQSVEPMLVVRGTVLDPTRAPVAGARVTAVPSDRGHAVSTVTDQRGQFRLDLAAVDHTVTIHADGFVDLAHQVSAAAPPSGNPEFVLQVSGVQERVDVSAAGTNESITISTATRTPTPLRDVPQSITVVNRELMADQLMTGIGDLVRYVPGITAHQGENNRDDVVIRGNRSSADFFVDGVRDDIGYYRDLYNLDRVEALKGPNAMIFGRGGGGGVINRVVKEPVFRPVHGFSLQTGGQDQKRVTGDVNQQLGIVAAVRVNAMYEHTGSFRDGVGLERAGVNPTLSFTPRSGTRLTFGYEYLHDTRVADRGITSVAGRPAQVPVSTYYGDPDQSEVKARVHIGSTTLDQRIGGALLRSRTVIAGYDRFYQNFVPGAVTADQRFVALTAYNNASDRTNVFNQTDVTYRARTAGLRHTMLAGVEFGRQLTDNFRRTGFFNNTASSVSVPFDDPRVSTAVTFRQNATDADNHVQATVAAMLAQDQLELSEHVQVLGGIRVDRFDLRYHNNRNGETLDRADTLVSPRAGIVFKPVTLLSIYSSYGVSYLPSAGDQFSSLTAVTEQLEPEKFINYEVGLKWDMLPALSLTTAVYRLDRTNTRSTDPNDPTRIVQTGSQRTNGIELGVNGRITQAWRVAGGYAYQDAFVSSATVSAPEGAQVGQVPHHTFSLWNTYQASRRLGLGLGLLHRSDMFATFTNTVTLPGYIRVDGAVYFSLTKDLRLQANVENVFDRTYYVNADSNTNISPGSTRTLRVALTKLF